MASAVADHESALRESVRNLLTVTAGDFKSSDNIERAIASALSVFHSVAAHFASDFNKTRPQCGWDKLPVELMLEVVRCLPLSCCAKLLGVSHDMRALVLSDPSLWTTISTPTPIPSDDARAEFLRTMVARSGNCPLDIVWTDPWNFLESFPAPPREIIFRALPRAKTLTLHVSYFEPGEGGFWASSAPLLEKLSFSFFKYLTTVHCAIRPGIWAGHVTPALLDLELPTIIIEGPPCLPFESVLSLQVDIGAWTSGTQWFWNWFPHVQKLTVYVCGDAAPLIPAPPASLRRVILHPDTSCTNPLRVLGGWRTHSLRLLELYGPEDALEAGLEFLDPAKPLSAAFTQACCPEDPWRNATVVRAGDMTLAIRSDSTYAQCLQIHTPGLRARVENLTLSADAFTSALRDGIIAFPALRSLTVLGSDDLREIPYDRRRKVRAPALEALIVDLVSEGSDSVNATIELIPNLVSRIQHTSQLREIVIFLPDDFGRHSLAVPDVMTRLEPVASRVRIEYHPAAQCRQDPCICSALRF